MTKKDYKAFATILRMARKMYRGSYADNVVIPVIEDMMCDYFKADNPLFDIKRFKLESTKGVL